MFTDIRSPDWYVHSTKESICFPSPPLERADRDPQLQFDMDLARITRLNLSRALSHVRQLPVRFPLPITSPTNSHQGIDALASPDDGFFKYVDHASQASFTKVLDELEEYIAEAGPFDAIMAFSQGAALAAAIIIRKLQQEPIQQRLYPIFKCAVFFCGAVPGDPSVQLEEHKRLLDPEKDGEIIDIPTAHIWGGNDQLYPTFGPILSRLCKQTIREDFVHEGGHEIPGVKDPEAVAKSIRAIKRTIERALTAQ